MMPGQPRSSLRLLLLTVILAAILLLAHRAIRQPVLELDLPATFAGLAAAAESGNWTEAHSRLAELREKWKQARSRVLFNAGIDSLREFEIALARLDKMIQQEEQAGALAELATLRVLWTEFISF